MLSDCRIFGSNNQPNQKNTVQHNKQQEVDTMIPEKLREVLKQDGVVAIATLGPEGPHMVNTWNSYIQIAGDGRLLIPAGYMHLTEANIAFNNNVLITLGSSKVAGNLGARHRFPDQGNRSLYNLRPRF
jgi:hypothetical protein